MKKLIVAALLAFSVNELTAGTLTGTFSPIATGFNVNLTTTGKLDWVQWGLYTGDSINRKASVTPQIGNYSLLGSSPAALVYAYQYTDNYNGYSWYDGTPVTTAINTTNGVWAYQTFPYSPDGAIGSGFQLTVPADTTQRILLVYVGAYGAKGKFTAALSDGSAAAFANGSSPGSTVDNPANGPGGVFAITFAANSSNQTLTVTWTLVLGHTNDGNVTLQAAALTATGADNPPFAVVTNPVNHAAFAMPTNITIQASAQDFDGTVTNVAFYAGATKLGQTTTSPYSFTWTNVPRGDYLLTAAATDNGGVTASSQPVEIFVYGSGGSQTNSVTASPAAVDLTAEGTADWADWGLLTSASFDCKNLVPRQISNFTVLGTNSVQQYSGNYTAFAWSDGTPDASVNGAATGVFITGATNGFRITAPADKYPRQLNVYVGGYGVQGQFQAGLSDLSAAPYTDTSVSNVYGNSYVVYTINYTAATNNQQLIVDYQTVQLFDSVYGNVTLQAATLQGGPPQAVQIVNPQWQGNACAFSFLTQANNNYTVQYTALLAPASWQTLASFPGNGTMMSVTNQNATNAACFYRVVTQ